VKGKNLPKEGGFRRTEKKWLPSLSPMSNNSPETAIKTELPIGCDSLPPPSKGREKLNLFQEAGQMV